MPCRGVTRWHAAPRCINMLSQERLFMLLTWFPIILLSVATHEFVHCWTTDRLGDDTPRRAGRVTLNPLKHIDPLGAMMMVVAAMAGIGFGWGKASPFNPANFRHPERDRMLTALAGPVSNMLQAIIWAALLGTIGNISPLILNICFAGVLVNISLGLFNLLPIFPLDGHHILGYFVSPNVRRIIDNPAWMYLFLAVMFIPDLKRAVLGPLSTAIFAGAKLIITIFA